MDRKVIVFKIESMSPASPTVEWIKSIPVLELLLVHGAYSQYIRNNATMEAEHELALGKNIQEWDLFVRELAVGQHNFVFLVSIYFEQNFDE